MNENPTTIRRRKWLVFVARYSLLSGMGLYAWSLALRSETCLRFTLPCQECKLLAACRQPRASNARAEESRASNDVRGQET